MSVCVYKKVREPGLEPGSGRWQRPIVPLDHSRCIDGLHNFLTLIDLRNLQKIIVSRLSTYIRRRARVYREEIAYSNLEAV